jgi:hypothetical protein
MIMSSRQTHPAPARPTHLFYWKGCLITLLVPLLAISTIGLGLVLAAGGFTRSETKSRYSDRAAEQVPGAIAPFFTPAVQYWSGSIRAWSDGWQLDANLAATVMQIESCGDPEAISSAGARGLFQVMPLHFISSEDPFDPDINARRGLGYLAQCAQAAQGDVQYTLACYNGGIRLLSQDETDWPTETSSYVYWGTGIYDEASLGGSESIFLKEWLTHGGSRLCQQANQRLGLRP